MVAEEKQVRLSSGDDTELEGMLIRGTAKAGAVICHPHPQYGGSMHNNVVFAARDALAAKGFWTLRFNFRGVGRSQGSYDGGLGEAMDVAGACRYLKTESEAEDIHVAAYSFGSFAFLKAVSKGLKVSASAVISPPVSFMDFSDLSLPPGEHIVIVGDRDEFCGQPDLERWLATQQTPDRAVESRVLESVDHFYSGSEIKLRQSLDEFF